MLIPVKNFPRQSVTIKKELVPLEFFWHTNSFIHLTSFYMYIVGFWNKKNWLTAPVTVGLSFYVWSFLLWSFHIWYKVKSSTCYTFSPFFFFIGSVKLLQLLRLLQKLLLYYYNSNFFPLTQQKETSEKCATQTRIGLFWRLKRRCSTETIHFTYVPISQQLPRLTSLYFFSFLEWALKLACTFRWQLSGAFEQLTSPRSWNLVSGK